MRTVTINDFIAAERQALATELSGLAPEQWDAPTLCAGWRVREVTAHITMPFRYSTDRYLRTASARPTAPRPARKARLPAPAVRRR